MDPRAPSLLMWTTPVATEGIVTMIFDGGKLPTRMIHQK
jgi:hypothetical protein